jgi:hypothetical protein
MGNHWLRIAVALPALACAGARAQEPCKLLVEGAGAGVRVAGPEPFAANEDLVCTTLPPVVHAAVEPGARTGPPPAPPLADSFRDARTFGDGDARDVRVKVRARTTATSGPFGLVCRWLDADDFYSLVWDPRRKELRLDRVLGGKPFTLAKAAAPAAALEWHELELQADGFRLQAFCDDAPVAQVMDGALESGRYGTIVADGAEVEFSTLTAAPPAPAAASLCAVTGAGRTEVVARAPAAVGGAYALCLRLDCPMPALLLTRGGFEWFLMHAPLEPLLLLGFGFGHVGTGGEIRGSFAWPRAPALSGQAALVGGLLGTPDGSMATGRLPWASARF